MKLVDRSKSEGQSTGVDAHREPASNGADLLIELRVSGGEGEQALLFSLLSPNGSLDLGRAKLEIEHPLRSNSSELVNYIDHKISNLMLRRDVDKEPLSNMDSIDKLSGLGFELSRELLPRQLQEVLARNVTLTKSLQIVSDQTWFPWELFKLEIQNPAEDQEAGSGFLCCLFEIAHWPLTDVQPPQRQLTVDSMALFTAPNAVKDSFLEGVELERCFLESLIQSTSSVLDVSPDPATSQSLKALLDHGHVDIWHFATHTSNKINHPNEVGIYLDDGSLFRPIDLHGPRLKRISKHSPMVFINACHSAKGVAYRKAFGSWAKRWIEHAGCGAFLGPMWLVPDFLAFDFMRSFYKELWSGASLGAAVRTARVSLREISLFTPIWTAYRIYGDTSATLVFKDHSGTTTQAPKLHRTTSAVRTSVAR